MSLVTISTSVPFDGLLVTGLYTSTPVQSAPIPAPAAFGFGKLHLLFTEKDLVVHTAETPITL